MRKLVLIVVLLILVLFLLVGCSSPAWAAPEVDPFLGVWKGSLAVAGVTFEFTMTFSRGEGGQIGGTIDIPAQGSFRLGKFKIEGRKISFQIDPSGAAGEPTFRGELDAAGKAVSGSFTQSGYDGTFSMDKQTPKAPAEDERSAPPAARRSPRCGG